MFKLFVASSLSAFAFGEEVVTGTTATFAKLVEDNPQGLLAEFYAPWCGHCKKLAPEYEKAAVTLKEDGVKIPLVKVDATVETKLGEEYKVNGYPTLKWFVGGSPIDYDGPREADGIVSWIKSMTGPAVTIGEPKEDDSFSVAYYGDSKNALDEVAKVNRKKATFYFVEKAGSNELVIKHNGETAVTVEAKTKEEIEKAFQANAFPLYGALDGDSFGKYMEAGNGMIWTLLDMTSDNMKEKVTESREMMTNVAKKVSEDKVSVTWTNTVEFGKVLESMFGITEFPKIVIQSKIGDKKNFIYDGEMTEAAILEYYGKVKSGEIKPSLKSEEPPAEPQTDPVKVITGKTVESLVFTKDKDVLLEVYAPWCGHCKKLEPEYLKVGKKVQKEGFEDILTIAKMDGTLNDSPVDSLSWSGFPTLYYVKMNDNTPVKYEGPRDAKGIWKWIKKNHTKADVIKAAIDEKMKAKTDKEAGEAKKEL